MTCPIEERYETFVLRVIGDLLIEGPSAPLYKNLIESGLGSAFSPVSGYDSYTKDTAFTVGLQGKLLLHVFSYIFVYYFLALFTSRGKKFRENQFHEFFPSLYLHSGPEDFKSLEQKNS